MADLVKLCPVCLQDFKKPAGYSSARWSQRVTCSVKCQVRKLSKRVTIPCDTCGKEHQKFSFRFKDNKHHNFCSRKCKTAHWTTKTLFSLGTPFSKGNRPYNLGLPEYKQPSWKGTKVGYTALHAWVVKHLGQPDTCEFCGRKGLKGREINWANKSQLYKRELSDWLRLCTFCHKTYDTKHHEPRRLHSKPDRKKRFFI